ncbi:MAG: hypothetical protein Q4D85_02925 [Corynebacterium sp.]|uniref:hypothetical protein n=1 Tax=Corynebacterium sp. TaxID=1720 RepID=UPI0026DBFB1B|nr:hypothetical protein [Corynebacterium sp.]MDO5097684.1 hypothetical protein [Corynebacterium sp.]
MMEQETLSDLMEKADAMPWGKACSAAWAEAAKRAGEEGDEHLEAICYLSLVSAFAMGGESTRIVAPFLWLDKFRKRRPDLFDDDMQSAFGWQYKYLVGVLRDLPTISADQLLSTLDEMEAFYRQRGDNLKAYYLRRYFAHSALGQGEQAQHYSQLWEAAWADDSHTEFNDCTGCDPMYLVEMYFGRGDIDAAIKAGERGLSDPENFCDSQPESLYASMLEPWLRAGRDDKAWPAFVKAMQKHSRRSAFIDHFPNHFQYLGLSAMAGRPQRWQRGMELFTRFLPWWRETETPRILLSVAAAAAFFFRVYPDQDEVIPVTLPGDDLRWITAPVVENPTVAQVHQWCTDMALELAVQYDNRPGLETPYMVEKVRRDIFDVQPVPELAPEGDIPDVSGQFAPAQIDYGLANHGRSVADSDLVVIDTNGQWRGFDDAQLAAAAQELNSRVPSIYTLRTGGWLLSQRLSAGTEREPAREMIAGALAEYDAGNMREAAQLADTAIHTESKEPIGVRLQGLYILARAAQAAGYPDEAKASARHCLNLAAACGLLNVRLQAAEILVEVLCSQREFSEAAEVADIAVAAVTNAENHTVSEVELSLRRGLISALDALDMDAAAAEHALTLASLTSKPKEKIEAIESAIRGFNADGEYDRGAQLADWIVDIAAAGLEEAQETDDAEAATAAATEYVERLSNAAWVRVSRPGYVSDAVYEQAERLFESAFEAKKNYGLLGDAHPQGVDAKYCHERAQAASECDRHGEAQNWFEQSRDLFIEAGDELSAAYCSIDLATMFVQIGRIAQAREVAVPAWEQIAGTKNQFSMRFRHAKMLMEFLNTEETDDN